MSRGKTNKLFRGDTKKLSDVEIETALAEAPQAEMMRTAHHYYLMWDHFGMRCVAHSNDLLESHYLACVGQCKAVSLVVAHEQFHKAGKLRSCWLFRRDDRLLEVGYDTPEDVSSVISFCQTGSLSEAAQFFQRRYVDEIVSPVEPVEVVREPVTYHWLSSLWRNWFKPQ